MFRNTLSCNTGSLITDVKPQRSSDILVYAKWCEDLESAVKRKRAWWLPARPDEDISSAFYMTWAFLHDSLNDEFKVRRVSSLKVPVPGANRCHCSSMRRKGSAAVIAPLHYSLFLTACLPSVHKKQNIPPWSQRGLTGCEGEAFRPGRILLGSLPGSKLITTYRFITFTKTAAAVAQISWELATIYHRVSTLQGALWEEDQQKINSSSNAGYRWKCIFVKRTVEK